MEQVEEMQAQPLVALGQIATEINAEREPLGLNRTETVLNQILELLGHRPHHRLRAQILQRADTRQRLVTAGLGKQGDVVADGLIAIGTAQVEHLHAAHFAEVRLGQVTPGIDDFGVRDAERPVLLAIRDDENPHSLLACDSSVVR